MVDPFSLTVNVLQIVQVCTSTIKTIDHLITRYKDAPTKLKSLRAESDVVRTSLLHLQSIFTSDGFLAQQLDAKPDLKAAVDSTLTGCWAVYILLDKDVQRVGGDPSGSEKLNWKKRGYLLFNDEIINDYLSQIRGQVQGLGFLLHCLQAESVSEIQAILRKADRFFSQIAQETLSIRIKHKDLDVPESIYDGRLINNEDQDFDFDDLVVNSKAYRSVMRDRKRINSISDLYPGNHSQVLISGASQSKLPWYQGNVDMLSDQPIEAPNRGTWTSQWSINGQAEYNPEDDLIDLSDEPSSSYQPNPKELSPRLRDLTNLLSDPGPFADENYGEPENGVTRIVRPNLEGTCTNMTAAGSESSLRSDHPEIALVKEVVGAAEKRDSGQAQLNRMSAVSSIDLPEPEEKIFVPEPEEKIPVSLPPELHSPISPETSFAKFNRPQDQLVGVPPTDDDHEAHLVSDMELKVESSNPNLQLDWAEEALRHCHISQTHEERKRTTQRPRASIPLPEQALRTTATHLVEYLANGGSARALFLKARWIERHDSIRRDNFLLASSKGYHRAHYYIGQIFEAEHMGSSQDEALRRYKAGASQNDIACQFRLAKAYLEGSLGLKKNQKEGVPLLEQAAAGADKDFPDPLHYLASLQSTPPKHFTLTKSLISHNPRSAGANFRRAASLGHAPSQVRVGLAHRMGTLSLAIDQPLSLHYLHLAARRGLAQADYEIANALFWGSAQLLGRYPRRAYAHARRAAEDEWAEAFALLGMAYEQGVGVERDLKMACSWYLRGASAGDVYAERKVEVLRGRPVFGFRKASSGGSVTS